MLYGTFCVDSAPRLGVYYFLSLTLSVCPSVSAPQIQRVSRRHCALYKFTYLLTYGAPSNCFFFFDSRWNWAIFRPSVLNVALYKTVFFDFWFRPPNAQNLLPKTLLVLPLGKSVHTRVMAATGNLCTQRLACWADLCCHGDDIWARRGVQAPTGLFCVFVSQYQCNWLPGKTRLWNDLLCVVLEIKLYSISPMMKRNITHRLSAYGQSRHYRSLISEDHFKWRIWSTAFITYG